MSFQEWFEVAGKWCMSQAEAHTFCCALADDNIWLPMTSAHWLAAQDTWERQAYVALDSADLELV